MSTAFRNFILTFILSIILFVILGYVFINDIYPDIKDSGKEPDKITVTDWTMPENSGVTPPEQISGFSYTQAFFCLDNRDTLCASVVIHVDDGYHTCTKITVPTDKHVEVSGSETTVAEFYKRNSSSDGRIGKAVLDLYKGLTGFNVDKYFVVSYSALGDIADFLPTTSVGALTYTPQSDIKYKDPLYDTVSLINPDADKYVTERAKKPLTVTKELLEKMYYPGTRSIDYPVVPSESENEVSRMISSLYSDIFDMLFVTGKLSPTTTVTSSLLTCIGGKGTNLSGSELAAYSKYIFASTDDTYIQHSVDYSSHLKGSGMKILDWENAVADIGKTVKAK